MKCNGGFSAAGGKLSGRTGTTEYFFFTCPKCPGEQVMRVLDYEFSSDARPIVRDERKKPEKYFSLAFCLYCPNCQFEDVIKIDNSHQAGPLEPK